MDIKYLKEISKPKPYGFSLRGTLFGLVSEIVHSREVLEITCQPNDNPLGKNDIEAPAVLVNYETRPQKGNHMFVCFPLLALLLLVVLVLLVMVLLVLRFLHVTRLVGSLIDLNMMIHIEMFCVSTFG